MKGYVFQHLTELETMWKNHREDTITQKEFGKALRPFADEEVIDQVRIISFYEHTAKAWLLVYGYIIHEIDLPQFRNVQKSRPISIAEAMTAGLVAKDLSHRTIGMTALLREGYKRVIDLPVPLVDVIEAVNDDRNRVHLRSVLSILLSDKTVPDLKKLHHYAARMILEVKKVEDEKRAVLRAGLMMAAGIPEDAGEEEGSQSLSA